MADLALPEPIRSPLLTRISDAGIRHGFFTRVGGVSEGSIYHGLNTGMGSRDAPGSVSTNRHLVAMSLGVSAEKLATPHQVHSAAAIVANNPFDGERPEADAVVTATPGIAAAVVTADCGPVLFADPRHRVVAAAHAGWPGALAGIIENTVEAMIDQGAQRKHIVAVLGPSISQPNYEVGEEFLARFLATGSRNQEYFLPGQRPMHYLFDLNRYTLDRMLQTGIQAEALFRCTYSEQDLFYSYRRATHRQESDYGRQISAIILEDR